VFLDLFILKSLRGDFVEVRILKKLGGRWLFSRVYLPDREQDHNKSQGKLRYPAFRTVPHREMLAFVPFDEHVPQAR